MKLKKILFLAVSLIVILLAVQFVWNFSQKRDAEKLITNWKVCDVHTTSIYTTRGSGGQVRLEWQRKHSITLPDANGTGGPSLGMTDEDLRTCLLMKEDEVK